MSRAPLVALMAFFSASPLLGSDLQYRFPASDVLRYKFNSSWSCMYKAKEGKTKMISASEYEFDMRGRSDDGRGEGVRVVIRSVKNRRVEDEKNILIDSRKTYTPETAAKEPLCAVACGMVGDGFEAVIGERGHVYSVGGFVDLLARGASRGLTGSRILEKALAAVLRRFLSDDSMKTDFSLVFIAFPNDVKQGTRWNQEFRLTDEDITEILRLEFAVSSLSATKAAFSASGTMALSIDGTEIPKTGEVTGAAVFDAREKRLLSSNLKASIKLPNVSLSREYEFKFACRLDPADAGPRSYEKPLGALQKLIERRVVKETSAGSAPIYVSENCDKIDFLACDGDEVRVVVRADSERGALIKVVTALGRQGWMLEEATSPVEE